MYVGRCVSSLELLVEGVRLAGRSPRVRKMFRHDAVQGEGRFEKLVKRFLGPRID